MHPAFHRLISLFPEGKPTKITQLDESGPLTINSITKLHHLLVGALERERVSGHMIPASRFSPANITLPRRKTHYNHTVGYNWLLFRKQRGTVGAFFGALMTEFARLTSPVRAQQFLIQFFGQHLESFHHN